MKAVRQVVTFLCLATTFSVTVPSLALSGEACQSEESLTAPNLRSVTKLDLSQLRSLPGWSAQSMASSESPGPEKVQAQPGGKGWSSYSTAKKTWIIVGSVVGAAAIIAAVSNSGGGGGGGY